MSGDAWTVTEAKANFSELLNRVRTEGPQRITRFGRTVAVLLPEEQWQQTKQRKENLADFLMKSPLRNSGIRLKRLGA